MTKIIIQAISFLYKDERIIVRPNYFGKFKVPVSEVVAGDLKTRTKYLTAMEVVNHDIIKNCDPTIYLENDKRVRVFPAGDCSYLPAQIEGLLVKHDISCKVELPKVKEKVNKGASKKFEYKQASLDMYGWYPGYDDSGTAD